MPGHPRCHGRERSGGQRHGARVIRGDVGTLRTHLEALFLRLPELVPIYGALAAASLPLAASRGAGPSEITAMQELIDHYTSAA